MQCEKFILPLFHYLSIGKDGKLMIKEILEMFEPNSQDIDITYINSFAGKSI